MNAEAEDDQLTCYEFAVRLPELLDRSPGHFDPALLGVFRGVATLFDRIYRETGD